MPLKPNMVDVQDPRAQSPEEDLSINNSRNQFDPVKLRFVPHSLKSEDDVASRGASENKFDPISLKFVPRVVPAVKAPLRSSGLDAKFWIAPDGRLFDVSYSGHTEWIFNYGDRGGPYDKDGRLRLVLHSHDEEDAQEVNEQQYYQAGFVGHGWTRVDGDSITTTKAKLRVAKDFVRERWLKDDREKEIYVELTDGGAFQGTVKEFMRWSGLTAAFDEDRNKPQQDKIGVHRDFITETNYGGQPDKITQGWDGVEERSMKEFYYAPGSGAFLARLIAEYPDYFGNRSEDQISQNPSGYDGHVSDSTEYGPRKFPHHDKDVRLDRLPKDQGYPKTGFPEPLWSVDILDNGENTYPLRARQALISLQAVLEKEKVTNEDQAFTVSYERDPNNPKAEAFAVVQDLYDPEPVVSAPFLYLRHSKSGKWEQSGGAWKAIGPNWPEGRLNEVLPWILSHVPEKLETAVAPKATPKKEKPAPKNSDNKGQGVKKIPKDADAIERVLFQIKPSDFVADVFFGNLAKASEEIRKLFEGRPTGDGNYFRWKVFNNNNLMVTRKV